MDESKRSTHELKRLIEEATEEEWRLASRGLWLCVEEVEASGQPRQRIKVWATLHFLPSGSPFCCGEIGCHLPWFLQERISEHVRQAMGLSQHVNVEFSDNRMAVKYHEGVACSFSDVMPHNCCYSLGEKPDGPTAL